MTCCIWNWIGGSGKSTIFKQLRSIHGAGFDDTARLSFRDHIFGQIIKQMKELIISLDMLQKEDSDNFGDCEVIFKF